MASETQENKKTQICEPSEPELLKPDRLSERPAPSPGQKWSFAEMQRAAVKTFQQVEDGKMCYHTANEGDDWFKVLMGNYPPDPPSESGSPSKIPVLPNLGLYFWYIPPWYNDEQTPHKEDEAYFVVDGRGLLCVNGKTQKVSKGDLVFVPRSAPHKFFTPFGEGLTLLIIFSPVYTGGPNPNPEDDCCRDPVYEGKSEVFVEKLVEKYKNSCESGE